MPLLLHTYTSKARSNSQMVNALNISMCSTAHAHTCNWCTQTHSHSFRNALQFLNGHWWMSLLLEVVHTCEHIFHNTSNTSDVITPNYIIDIHPSNYLQYVSINLNKRGEGDKNKGAAESSIKSVVSVVCPQLLVHCLFWSLLKWNQFLCFNDAQKEPSVTPTPNTAGVLHTLSIPINGRLEKMNDGTSITPLLSHIPNPA